MLNARRITPKTYDPSAGRTSTSDRGTTPPCRIWRGLRKRSIVFRAIRLPNFKHHIECRTRRAAVERTFESANGAGDGRYQIRAGCDNHTRGNCGSIQAMVADSVHVLK